MEETHTQTVLSAGLGGGGGEEGPLQPISYPTPIPHPSLFLDGKKLRMY